jgi:hypothetical protein
LENFLNDFTGRNEMRPVRLEILSDTFGASEEAKNLPLLSISFEEKGSDAGDALISLGGASLEDTSYVTRTIKDVTIIATSDGDSGKDDALEITGASGEKAILVFEQPLEIEAKIANRR